uniref:Uncharacterized protein n=1 Tax=Oryza nivara TaxID=4536 RepID=A0A0E0I0D9_ORYNI
MAELDLELTGVNRERSRDSIPLLFSDCGHRSNAGGESERRLCTGCYCMCAYSHVVIKWMYECGIRKCYEAHRSFTAA